MQRIFPLSNNEEVTTRSGLWFVPLDFNGIQHLYGQSSELDRYIRRARLACTSEDDLTEHPYCGLPFVFPLTDFVDGSTYWIDIEPTAETLENVYWPSVFQMPTSPYMVKAGRWLVQYRVDCGDTPQCSLFISPRSHAHILRWHFSSTAFTINKFPTDKLRQPPVSTDDKPRPTWFVLIRFGSSSEATRLEQRSMIVTLEIGASGHAAATGKDLLEVAVASQYFRSSSSNSILREMPPDLQLFVNSLPEWHATIPITSLFSSYAF